MPSIFSKKGKSHAPPDSAHTSPTPTASNEGYHEQRQQYPIRTSSTHRLSAHLDQLDQQQQQQPDLNPAIDPPPKKSLRSRILGGHSKEEPAGKNSISRRQSVRNSDARLAEQQQQQQQQQWSSGSSAHLPASSEQDEDLLDPFLQRSSPHGQPQVRACDILGTQATNAPSLDLTAILTWSPALGTGQGLSSTSSTAATAAAAPTGQRPNQQRRGELSRAPTSSTTATAAAGIP